MDVQNIILECVRILSVQNKPIASFSELANIDLIASLLRLMQNKQDVKSSLDAVSSEIGSLFKEYFSSASIIDVQLAIDGDSVELSILFLLLIYISLLSNANLRSQFFSTPMSLSTELKLTHLMECIQEKSAVSHEELEVLVLKNLDFVVSSSKDKSICCSPQLRASSPCFIKNQTPLRDYLQSPSVKFQGKIEEKNRQISNLRQRLYSLEADYQELQDKNVALIKKREKTELERNKLSGEMKALMKEYEESTNSALKDEEEDKQIVLSCQKKIKFLEGENKIQLSECSKISEENEDLLKMLEGTQSQLQRMTVERDKLAESAESLEKAYINSESLLEEQSSEFKEMKNQLQELKRYFQEHKSFSKTFESFGGSSQNASQDVSMSSNSMDDDMMGFGEESQLQQELSSKDKVIKELTNEIQQLTEQLTSMEQKFTEKNTYCTSLLVKYEDLSGQLDISKKLQSSDEQKISTDTIDRLNKKANDDHFTDNKSLLMQIDNLKDENVQLHSKLYQLEEVKVKMEQKVEKIEALNVQHADKYENIMEANRNLLEKIILVKDEKESIQIMLNNFKEEQYSSSSQHTNLKDEVSMISSQKDHLEKELDEMRDNVAKKDTLIEAQQDKMCLLKDENTQLAKQVEDCKQELLSFKDGSIDNQRLILSAKEDAFKAEMYLHQTIDSLKDRLQATNETISKDKKVIEDLKSSFKNEMEKVMTQLSEVADIEKDNDILRQKYENSKKNIAKLTQQLEAATCGNDCMELQLKNAKSDIFEYRRAQRQSLVRLDKLEDERQPLKWKLEEVEDKLKQTVIEKNTLIAQLQLADTSLRHMKKDQLRGSFMCSSKVNIRKNELAELPMISKDDKRRNAPNKENNNMNAPPTPSLKPLLRSSNMTQRHMKKTSSDVNVTTSRQSRAPLTRAMSVAGCGPAKSNLNPRNAIQPGSSAVSDSVDDEEFVDGKLVALPNHDDVEALDWGRMSELQRRNSLYPPHMRCAYTAEMQYKEVPFSEDNLRSGDVGRLSMAPSYNLRKRSIGAVSTPCDRKTRRLTEATSTVQLPKSESWDIPVNSETTKAKSACPASPKLLGETRHGLSPANKVRRTPSSLSGILKGGKSPWKRLHDKEEGSSSSESSRKRIFRNPFGSKNYNVRSASMKNDN